MKHFSSPFFWECYGQLPENIQELADKNFQMLKKDSRHPSLHLKRVENYWSARVGMRYRAMAVEVDQGLLWFWIGTHSEYDSLIRA